MKMKKHRNLDSFANKRVSFIIVTKNRAAYLEKMLRLHRKLIHPEDELIVIDGLSSDLTHAVVNRCRDLVDVFITEPDLSCTHALNKGILIAQGKYIKQLPDDDVIYQEAMEQAIRVLEEHTETDILVCGGTRQQGNHFSAVYLPPGVNYGKRVEDVFRYGSCGVGFVIRRSALSKIGLLHPTDMAGDNEFVIRAISRGANVKFCRINLFNHPIYDHSVTVSRQRDWMIDHNRLLKQYCSSWFRWHLVSIKWLYKLRLWVQQHQRLNRLAEPLICIVRKVRNKKKEKPLWDGGFS